MKKIPKHLQTEEERLMYRFLLSISTNINPNTSKPGAFLVDVKTQKVLYDYFLAHGYDVASLGVNNDSHYAERKTPL